MGTESNNQQKQTSNECFDTFCNKAENVLNGLTSAAITMNNAYTAAKVGAAQTQQVMDYSRRNMGMVQPQYGQQPMYQQGMYPQQPIIPASQIPYGYGPQQNQYMQPPMMCNYIDPNYQYQMQQNMYAAQQLAMNMNQQQYPQLNQYSQQPQVMGSCQPVDMSYMNNQYYDPNYGK